MDIKQIRQQYPQYDQVSDGDLALGLYRKSYAGKMHIRDFMKAIDPEDTARFTISDQMKDYWENEVSRPLEGETEAQAKERLMGADIRQRDDAGIARGFGQGITFGGMDEVVGAGAAALHPLVNDDQSTFPERYQAYSGRERDAVETFREDSPGTALASEVAGGLATLGAAPALMPLKGAGLGATTGNAALTGTAYGTAYGGLSADPGERGEGALRSAVIGGATGTALPLAARGLGWLFRPTKTGAPLDKLKAASQELVKRAESNGLVVNPGKYKKFLNDMGKTLDLDPVNHAGTKSLMDRMENEMGKAFTPARIQQLRMRINDAVTTSGGQIDKNGQKALTVLNKFDDLVESLTPSDVITSGAPPKQVARWLKQHRALWRRYRKGGTLKMAEDLAELNANSNQATDYAQALRTQYRALSRRILKGQERGFTKSEAEAIKLAATGNKMNRGLKMLSKFRFDPSGNMIGSGMGAGVGFMVGGVPGAVAVPAIGTAASLTNNALMKGHLNRAAALVGGADDKVVQSLMQKAGVPMTKQRLGGQAAQSLADIISNPQVTAGASRAALPLFGPRQ